MVNNSVCCVIVTYNIGNRLSECYNAIKNQVEKVVIVDNGSNSETIKVLKKLEKNEDIFIVYNYSNKGIAYALNQGVEYALKNNYYWVLTLDHDSISSKNMVYNMLLQYSKINDKNRVGMLCPRIYDINVKKFLTTVESSCNEVETSLQSGCLIKSSVFKNIGKFNDELFIYYVDEEYFYRICQHNYKIFIVRDSLLYHEEGKKENKKILLFKTHYNNYSKNAVYYLVRNSIYMIKYKKNKYLFICFKRIIGIFGKIILFDKQRLDKLKFAFRGLYDGIINNFGKGL